MEKDNSLSVLTEKDVLILKKLFEDGRKSSASISKEIDLGREIVNYRIKRLIKKNLIVNNRGREFKFLSHNKSVC